MQFAKPYKKLNIYHITFETQFLITSTLIRIQEFYESNIPAIQNHYFSLESLIHEYTISNDGDFDYFTKWSGFNFPGELLVNFLNKFTKHISNKEHEFITFLQNNIDLLNNEKYYVISTYRDEDINHEIAHGLYYLNSNYKEQMDKLTADLYSEIYECMYEQLDSAGYCNEVIYDEIQAYMLSNHEDLEAFLGIRVPKEVHNKYLEVYKNVLDKEENNNSN
jgi:hypothetical protein